MSLENAVTRGFDAGSVSLRTCEHQYLAVDMPGWMNILRDLWVALLFIFLGILIKTGYHPAVVVIVFLASFAVRWYLQWRSVLSWRSPAESERNCEVSPRGQERFMCFGTARELEPLRTPSSEFFAPVVIRFHAQSRSFRDWAMLVISIGVWAVMLVIFRVGVLVALAAAVLCCFLIILPAWTSPKYYRLSPGQLEVLEVSLLGGRVKQSAAIPLQSVRIVCRFDKQSAEILKAADVAGEQPRDATLTPNAKILRVNLADIPKPHEFVYYLFRAAMCERRAPELPGDALLG